MILQADSFGRDNQMTATKDGQMMALRTKTLADHGYAHAAVERVTDVLAQELGMDPAELRLENFIPPEKFPYKSSLGWEYDSGNYRPPCARRWT
jgi:CO/xanthine dehydrogenase Mo-binding subunit